MMLPASQVQNRYTDSPELHPNLVSGSLHLLFWIIFHPSAWEHHITRIDSTLSAVFTLTDINRKQWRSPAIRRLMIQSYLVLPLLAGATLTPILWLGNVSPNELLVTTLHFTAIVFIMNLFYSLAVSFATGIVGGVVTGILVGLIGSQVNIDAAYNVAVGLSIGLAASINGNFSKRKQTYSPARQIGGIAIGAAIGVMMVLTRLGITAFLEMVGLPAGIAYSLARSTLVCVSFGLAVGGRHGFKAGVLSGIGSGLFYNIVLNTTQSSAPDIVRGFASGSLFGVSLIAMFALPYTLAKFIAGGRAGAWAGALGSYGRHIYFASGGREGNPDWLNMPLGFGGVILGLTIMWWRPVLFYPLQAAWNQLLYQADKRRFGGTPGLLRWNCAFWDESQFLPLYGLDDHVLLTLESNPPEGYAALEYLATGHQRWAAQSAQIELDVRQLERCAGVMAIRQVSRNLVPDEFSDSHIARLLRSFSRIGQDVDAALNQTSVYNQRLALKAVETRLDELLRELTRSSEPYAVRFRPSAVRWRQIVADRIQELAAATEALQEISSPYVIGLPLMGQQEVFVGRTDISTDIEQLLPDQVCPPIFLYGQRRMGKTSLLNNLGHLLPSTILPIFVDLQGPVSWATNHAGFLYSISQAMITSARQQRGITLPPLSREVLADDPFVCFDEWLNEVERALDGKSLKTVLLALDEFEALDDALTKGRFDEQAVLGMLRHLIQHRPRFRVLIAGSHTLKEFHRWAGYLINARVLHLSYLNEAETCQLIEQPIKNFALRYKPEASRRVLELTRGHPFLVQLLCSEIVALKNRQIPAERRLTCLADVEAAVEKALEHGSFYFADIQHNRVNEAGLSVLGCLALRGEGGFISREDLLGIVAYPAQLEQTLAQLIRRELIEAVNGEYRFQVELVRCWFAQADL